MTVARNDIFRALFDLSAGLSWGDPPTTWITRSQRLRTFADVPSEQKPAFFQVEPSERFQSKTRTFSMRQLRARWVIYLANAQNSDPDSPPSAFLNDMLDVIEPLFADPVDENPANVQNLGGLVHRAWIDGEILKDPGDTDNFGIVVIPISILVP